MKKSEFLPILLLLISPGVTVAQEEKRAPYPAMAPLLVVRQLEAFAHIRLGSLRAIDNGGVEP